MHFGASVIAWVLTASSGQFDAHAAVFYFEITGEISPSYQHSLGVRNNGTIVVGGFNETSPYDGNPRLLLASTDLASRSTVDLARFEGFSSAVTNVSRNGEWFSVSATDDNVNRMRNARGQVSDPDNVEEVINPYETYWFQPHLISNEGEFFGSVGNNITGVRAPVGGVLEPMPSLDPQGYLTDYFSPWSISDNGSVIAGWSISEPFTSSSYHIDAFLNGSSDDVHRLTGLPYPVDTGVAPEVSPDGRLITAVRFGLEFDPDNLQFIPLGELAYYRDLDGIVGDAQTTDDYELVEVLDELARPYNGYALAAANGWLGGVRFPETVSAPDATGDDIIGDAWLMNVNTMIRPILLEDYLLSNGVQLPSTPAQVWDLVHAPDGSLVMLVQSMDDRWFLLSDNSAIPEPSPALLLSLLTVIAGLFRARRFAVKAGVISNCRTRRLQDH